MFLYFAKSSTQSQRQTTQINYAYLLYRVERRQEKETIRWFRDEWEWAVGRGLVEWVGKVYVCSTKG